MEYRTKQILNRGILDGGEVLKEMFKVLSDQGNGIQNKSERLRSKTQEIAHAVEDVEQGEHSFIDDGIANLNNHFGNQFGVS